MIELILQRTHAVGPATFGELRYARNNVLICYTLEDEVREVEGEPVASWKIKGSTAIPAGFYNLTLDHSPRFGPNTLTVNDVRGFSGVRMHAGNTSDDTEGCPLLGMKINDQGIVGGTSKPAVEIVKRIVQDGINGGEMTFVDVRNAEATA
tara:strand:- start:404 stop:856 length:453 start_codon:yes stop_codon:yes gene_type:complete